MARTAEKPKEGMGARVERERIKRGWSQEDLAKKLDTTRSSIKNKELGERPFSLEEANILCEVFNVTLDYLVNGVRTKNVSIHDALGIDDEAIGTMREFYHRESAAINSLSKALKSYWVLKAITQYMDHTVEKKGCYLSEDIQKKGSFETCTMSQESMEKVLELHVMDAIREAKTGEKSIPYYSAVEDFEPFAEEDKKLAEPSEFKGAKKNGKKK